MPKTLKKIWDIVSTVLVILVVLFAVFLLGSRLTGLQVYNVVSGSMEPNYNVGDLIYVKSVDPDSVKVDDVITFVLNEDLVVATHRVVSIDAENRYFYTKGDANETADASPVHFNNLIGVPVIRIPLLGYVSDYIKQPPRNVCCHRRRGCPAGGGVPAGSVEKEAQAGSHSGEQ